MLLRDKKLQLIHMYNLLSLEKRNISKLWDSDMSLLLEVSDSERCALRLHSRDTDRLFMLRLED